MYVLPDMEDVGTEDLIRYASYPLRFFCFPALILCVSLTSNVQPGHNDRLNEIHFEDMLSQKHITKKSLGHFQMRKKSFSFSSSLYPSSSFIQQIFTKHILLRSDGGEILLLDEEHIFLEECFDITFVTTMMSYEVVHVKCLLQCSVYNRLLVKNSSFYFYFVISPVIYFFLLPLLLSPLSFLPSPPPSSTNYLPCFLQYCTSIFLFIVTKL